MRKVALISIIVSLYTFPSTSFSKVLYEPNVAEFKAARFVQLSSGLVTRGKDTYADLEQLCDNVSGLFAKLDSSSRASCTRNNNVITAVKGQITPDTYRVSLREFETRMHIKATSLQVSGDVLLVDTTKPIAKGELIEKYLTLLNIRGLFNGSSLVAEHGTVLTKKGYGFTTLDNKTAIQPSTKFAIASITKSFTATAILQLQEQGKLRVEDTIDKYMPELPYAPKITIRQLLTHTAGLPKNMSEYNLNKVNLAYEPGKGQKYSNIGYILLGEIIGKASGIPYETYMQKNIFDRIGLKNTGYDLNRLPNPIKGYAFQKGKGFVQQTMDYPSRGGSGSLYSTVEDLLLWDRALYTDKLLGKESLKQMFTMKYNSWGYGWILVNYDFGKVSQLTGTNRGFRTHIRRNMTKDYVIILLSNHSDGKIDLMAKDIERILLS